MASSESKHCGRLLVIDEACEYLRLGKTKLHELMKEGDLQTVKIGRSTRFRTEDLEEFIESRLTRRGR